MTPVYPVRIDLVEGELDPRDASRVATHLEAGGLVIYPTETVYGLGSTPEGPGLVALSRAKDRHPDRPALLVLADREQAVGLSWEPAADALAETFWPGALTLVLADPDQAFGAGVRSSTGAVAVRISSHPVPSALARALGRPVTSTSANRRGQPPVRDGDEAMALAHEIQKEGISIWVLDGGALPLAAPSTLVDCSRGPVRVLREGEISQAEVLAVLEATGMVPEGGLSTPEESARRSPLRVLFVCSGNTCRSPLAEVLLMDRYLTDLPPGTRSLLEVASAGTGAVAGGSASRGSQNAAARHGLDLEGHRSTHLDAEVVAGADLILTMSAHHLSRVAALGGADRSALLSAWAAGSDNPFGGPPVADPFGGDDETYEATYLELDALVAAVLERLAPTLKP